MLKRLVLFTSAAIGLAACAKQEMNYEAELPAKLIASVEETDLSTRVQLEQNKKTVWTEGDQLSVFFKNEVNDCWQFDGETGDRNGTFTRLSETDPADALFKDIFVVYPYLPETSYDPESKLITIDFPHTQTYKEGSYSVGSNVMFAKTNTDYFTLKNLSGYIQFQLKGEYKVMSVKLKGNNDEQVSGLSYISIENQVMGFDEGVGDTGGVESRAGGEDLLKNKEIILDCGSEGVQLRQDKVTDFYITVVPQVFSEGFTIEVLCDNGYVMQKSTSASLAIRRNTIYKMKELMLDADAEEIPIDDDAVVTDLSSGQGPANCYIVTKAGLWGIPAVKGNDKTQSIEGIASVSLLWESLGNPEPPKKCGLIQALDYHQDDKMIKFQTSDKKGNAVIAAKDADGNILWSWHIWLTDQPEDIEYLNEAGTMMDRNLGATSTSTDNPSEEIKTYGLLYQWGRKDPFMGLAVNENGNKGEAKYASAIDNVITKENNSTVVDYTIEHPTWRIIGYASYQYSWLAELASDDGLWSKTKTRYDPCPPGYRIPDGSSNRTIWSDALDINADHNHEIADWDIMITDSSGFVFKKSDPHHSLSNDGDVYYPAAGYILGDSNSQFSFEEGYVNCTYLWAASGYISLNGENDYEIDNKKFNIRSGGNLDICANAYSVRCQKHIFESWEE